MGFFAPLINAFGALSTASKIQIASSVVGGAASYAAAKEQRKQAIADQDNQYVRMRNAAQRAGFNPLTVMRATGGQGFTGLPTISKAAAFGNAAAGIFDAFRQSPIDKYNKEVRELEIKQRKATISNTIANTAYTGILAKHQTEMSKDAYAGFGDKIPVKFGLKSFHIPVEMAKRLGIKPNSYVSTGEIAELFGEGSEVLTAFAVQAQREMFGISTTGLAGGDKTEDTSFDKLVGMAHNAINSVRGQHSVPAIPPFSDTGWANEYKKYLN